MKYKLGKNPAVFDRRTLRFGDYVKPEVEPPPASVDYGARVDSWPMYDNDRYGDCTCAAAGHMIQSWTANAGKEVTPSDQSVLEFYEHFVGTPPPPDAGCSMLEVLRYWRSTGVARHKVLAFTALELENEVQAKDALWMFGGVYIGVELPDFATRGDMLSVPWVVPPRGPVGDAAPNPNNGHCIPAVAYDARNLYVVTWGALKSMSWQFYRVYAEEAYAVLSKDFVERSGRTIAGFDLATLEEDLAKIPHLASPVPAA